MYLATLLLVPFLLGGVAKLVYRRRLTWGEYWIMEGVTVAILLIGYALARNADLSDTEFWNGQITEKRQEPVSCWHAYTCNCHLETSLNFEGELELSTECDTCYRHQRDYNWLLLTNIGESIAVERVDSQGAEIPPAWNSAYIGEPVAVRKYYMNYARRNPGLVMRMVEEVDHAKYQVPDYPAAIHSLYKVDRFLTSGYSEPEQAVWNQLLQGLNGRLGPKKEVNLIVVAANSDSSFEYALEEKWLAGKKNDLVVILGVPDYPRISWVGIVAWSQNQELRDNLTKEIMEVGYMNQRDQVLAAIEKNVQKHFTRRTMAEIRHQLGSLEPGPLATTVLYVLGVLVLALMVWVFAHNDTVSD